MIDIFSVRKRVRGHADVGLDGGVGEPSTLEPVKQLHRALGLDDVLQHAAPHLPLLRSQPSYRSA